MNVWITILSFLSGALLMSIILSKIKNKDISKATEEWYKRSVYFLIMCTWMEQLQRGRSLIPYFYKKRYNKVAIYGMAELGERLYYELKKSGIEVACVIDKSKNIKGEFELLTPDDDLPEVDVVIVTSEYYFEDIKDKIKNHTNAPIIRLSRIIANAFQVELL